MSRYGTILGGSANAISAVVQTASAEDMIPLILAAVAPRLVGVVDPVATSITLAGAGDGHMFFLELEGAAGANVDGGAQITGAEFFLAATAEELQAQLAAVQTSLPILDVQIAGSSKGQRVMAMVLFGTIRSTVPPDVDYPVPDDVFAINDNLDPTKFLTVQLAGQASGTTQTITTKATVSRPFSLPDISGTAVVVDDTTGKVWMGLGVTGDVVTSNAGMQYSTLVANRAQLRTNQFGANNAGPGATGFKSRGTTLGAFAGCINGDLLYRITAIGVAPDNASIPLAATASFQVPPGFAPAGQNYLPTEFEVALVSLAGPINSRRPVLLVTSEGVTETLAGLRAGGKDTTPTTLGSGALWSSGLGDPNGVVTGSPGDLFSRTDGGAGTSFYVKELGVGTNTGWVAK